MGLKRHRKTQRSRAFGMLFDPLLIRPTSFLYCVSTSTKLGSSFYFPRLLPFSSLFLFSYGGKRVAADNPLLPCLILIAFTGSRLDQYTPAAFYRQLWLLPYLRTTRLRFANLNYPKGCFDEGFSIFSFPPSLILPPLCTQPLHILGRSSPVSPGPSNSFAQSDLLRRAGTFTLRITST